MAEHSAIVAFSCSDHAGRRMFYNEGRTDDNGHFSILVKIKHEHELCQAYTVSSPTSCNIRSDSSRGPVFLTVTTSGVDSIERKIGPFAFRSTKDDSSCEAVMAEYSAVDRRAGPAGVIIVGVRQTDGTRRVLSQVESEGYHTSSSITRNCCFEDYCPYCKSFAVEEEDPYLSYQEYSG